MELDATARRILNLLQRDARVTVTDLAKFVGRSRSTVRERIAILEAAGIIRGYHAIVDVAKAGYATLGYVLADVNRDEIDYLPGLLDDIPQVSRAMLTTGERPLVAEVHGSDAADLERLVHKELVPLGVRSPSLRVVTRPLLRTRPISFAPEANIPGGDAMD